MFLFVLIMVYWFFAALFGNDFIQFSVRGINTFYVLMGLCIVYFLLCTGKGRRANFCSDAGRGFYNAATIYMAIAAIYLVLSIFHFTSIFNIDVNYRSSYILRQGYLIFTFPIAFVIIDCTVKYWDTIRRYIFSRQFLIMVWVVLAVACALDFEDIVVMRPLTFGIASLILILKKKSILSWTIFLYTTFGIIQEIASSSSLIGAVLALLIFFFTEPLSRFLSRDTGLKIWLPLSVVVVLLVMFTNQFVSLISGDANTTWRWQYWMNEIAVLVNTFGIGVGYGTAYASNSIYREINNANVFLNTVNSQKGGIFVVTQHSSFMNALYRTGIVGFAALINFVIIKPLRWFGTVYSESNSEEDVFLKWGIMNYGYNLMIILMNPGLESPRFAIGFLFTFAFLIAGLIHKEHSMKILQNGLTETCL